MTRSKLRSYYSVLNDLLMTLERHLSESEDHRCY